MKQDISSLNEKFDRLEVKFDERTDDLKVCFYRLMDKLVKEARILHSIHMTELQSISIIELKLKNLNDRVTKLELAIK